MYCRYCGEPMNENQAVCLKCGVPAGTGNAYCPNCGNKVAEEAVICVNCGVGLKSAAQTENAPEVKGISERSLVTSIVLSIITCGIYSIYWFIKLTNEMNTATNRKNDTSGGVAFILTLITCSIYGLFWAYKFGEKRDIVAKEENGSAPVLYLVLALFGLNIIVLALAQDALNKAIANQKKNTTL